MRSTGNPTVINMAVGRSTGRSTDRLFGLGIDLNVYISELYKRGLFWLVLNKILKKFKSQNCHIKRRDFQEYFEKRFLEFFNTKSILVFLTYT